MSKTLAQLADEIWAWQQEALQGATIRGALQKLVDECAEAINAEFDGLSQRREELADVWHLLVMLYGQTGTIDHMPNVLDSLEFDEMEPSHTMPRLLGRCEWSAALDVQRWEAFGSPEGRIAGLDWALASWAGACATNDDWEHMPAAIEAKLAKNKARKWAKPAADGTISHVREGGC